MHLTTCLLASAVACRAAVLDRRPSSVSGTAVVNAANSTGTPKYLASGFINGIPATFGQIPAHFYQDIKFQFARSSGGQISPSGWTAGMSGYKAHFNSAKTDYGTAKAHGARFIMPLHGMWGGGGPNNTWPGDNGDWTEFDKFLDQLFSDWRAIGAAEDPKFYTEIWNEPELSIFWGRTREQWLDTWEHAYARLRSNVPHVKILGPTLTAVPSLTDEYWTSWSERVSSTGQHPDQYTWHMEPASTDMETAAYRLDQVRAKYGLPKKQININEYGSLSEQVPSGAAWYIAQLERINALGLRGNWFSGSGPLHDYIAGLVGKPNANTPQYSSTEAGYWPTAEFQVYKYYAAMDGLRLDAAPTSDKKGSVYATVGSSKLKILAGSNKAPGQWSINVTNLQELGFSDSGSVSVKKWTFPGQANHFAKYDAPVDGGKQDVPYSNGQLTLSVPSTDGYEAYAFEFNVPHGLEC